jgi:hypothetical protein
MFTGKNRKNFKMMYLKSLKQFIRLEYSSLSESSLLNPFYDGLHRAGISETRREGQ